MCTEIENRGPFLRFAEFGIAPKVEAMENVMAEKHTLAVAGLLTAGILFTSQPVMAELHGGGNTFGGSHFERRGLDGEIEHSVISKATLNLNMALAMVTPAWRPVRPWLYPSCSHQDYHQGFYGSYPSCFHRHYGFIRRTAFRVPMVARTFLGTRLMPRVADSSLPSIDNS